MVVAEQTGQEYIDELKWEETKRRKGKQWQLGYHVTSSQNHSAAHVGYIGTFWKSLVSNMFDLKTNGFDFQNRQMQLFLNSKLFPPLYISVMQHFFYIFIQTIMEKSHFTAW